MTASMLCHQPCWYNDVQHLIAALVISASTIYLPVTSFAKSIHMECHCTACNQSFGMISSFGAFAG